MNKERYIDIMEKAFRAYGDGRLRHVVDEARKNGVTEHGFPRLASDTAILLSHGRIAEYTGICGEMLDICFDDIPNAKGKANDFSVKELIFAVLELEKANVFPKERTDKWRNRLALINPTETYDCVVTDSSGNFNNWAAYNAAGEQLRAYAGFCGKDDNAVYIDRQIESQVKNFDGNGMYRDPGCPMLYDIVTRVQLALIVKFGYDGRFADTIREELLKSTEITLRMQSFCGEIPYGGRSNQFLFNEAMLAAINEYYASEWRLRSLFGLAGRCKKAAENACDAVEYWLDAVPNKHIKNNFPIESDFGCEKYAYFDKYMITLASFAYVAYLLSDDAVEPQYASVGGYNFAATSSDFHKIFMYGGDYSLEFDINADLHYDASGLGRIHKKGAPPQICLSVPFTGDGCGMELPKQNIRPLSLCGGICRDGDEIRGSDLNGGYRLISLSRNSDTAVCRLGGDGWTEKYILHGDIVGITVESNDKGGKGNLIYNIPVFAFDGADKTDIKADGKCLTVSYRGYRCVYECDGIIEDSGEEYYNRNGIYRRYFIKGNGKLEIKITIEKDCRCR